MWVLIGAAAAAAGALAWWHRASRSADVMQTVTGIRRQAGVLASIINMVNSLMDALMFGSRITAGSRGGSTQFGQRSSEYEAA